MKALKYLLSVSFILSICGGLAAQSKQDPVEIYGAGKDIVKLDYMQDPIDNSKRWIRADIVLDGRENPDKTAMTADEKRWIRDVVLDLTLVYYKPTAKTEQERWNPTNWIVLKSKASLVAIEAKKKSQVSFFIPCEIKDLYRLQDSQRLFFIIDLSVFGKKVELTKSNLKKYMSKTLSSKIRTMKQYDDLRADLNKAAVSADNWLVPLPDTPIYIQTKVYEDAQKSSYKMPFYKKEK